MKATLKTIAICVLIGLVCSSIYRSFLFFTVEDSIVRRESGINAIIGLIIGILIFIVLNRISNKLPK